MVSRHEHGRLCRQPARGPTERNAPRPLLGPKRVGRPVYPARAQGRARRWSTGRYGSRSALDFFGRPAAPCFYVQNGLGKPRRPRHERRHHSSRLPPRHRRALGPSPVGVQAVPARRPAGRTRSSLGARRRFVVVPNLGTKLVAGPLRHGLAPPGNRPRRRVGRVGSGRLQRMDPGSVAQGYCRARRPHRPPLGCGMAVQPAPAPALRPECALDVPKRIGPRLPHGHARGGIAGALCERAEHQPYRQPLGNAQQRRIRLDGERLRRLDLCGELLSRQRGPGPSGVGTRPSHGA